MKYSVACIVVDSLKRVLIAHRNPSGQMGGRWEFPGGKVEEGETPEDAVIREMDEEFGLRVSVGSLVAEAVFRHNDDDVQLLAYEVFLPAGAEKAQWTLTEHTEINWVAFDMIPLLNFVDSDKLIYPSVCGYFLKKESVL